jgi:hypothetical protein
MRYDISKATAPAMPTLGKGTECIKLLLSQASKDMFEPLVPMFFPVFGAHISGAEFQYLIQLEGTFWSNNLTLSTDRAGFWIDNTILSARILSSNIWWFPEKCLTLQIAMHAILI